MKFSARARKGVASILLLLLFFVTSAPALASHGASPHFGPLAIEVHGSQAPASGSAEPRSWSQWLAEYGIGQDEMIAGAVVAGTAVALGVTFGNQLGLAGAGGIALALYIAHIPLEILIFGAGGAAAWKSIDWMWGGGNQESQPVEGKTVPAPAA